ncbi:hypothetical protein DXE53_08900 [Escherichia coli O145]|nr:hypothetical protein DXE53_08900 [Escherichia coli O145]
MAGRWFYDELTYEERGSDGKWRKPGRGANEAFDLLVYADALAVLHGYEKIAGPPHRTGHSGNVARLPRRSVLVKRYPGTDGRGRKTPSPKENCGRSVRKIIHG